MSQLIDLSIPIELIKSDPNILEKKNIEHSYGGDLIWKKILFSKQVPFFQKIRNYIRYLRQRNTFNRHCFPDGLFLSNEFLTLSVHCGTHLDAPYHFGPRYEGDRALYINEIPIEWCYSNGVVLNLSHKDPCSSITKNDIQNELKRIGYILQPNDIVLIRTDSDSLWPTKEYFSSHPGMSREATEWLVEQGIKVIGIDTNGFDLPFKTMINNYMEDQNVKHLWPCHMLGRTKQYIHIEKLANLKAIPKAFGFKVACFPISIKESGAAWIRAVAIID